jgi:hypothetical protein
VKRLKPSRRPHGGINVSSILGLTVLVILISGLLWTARVVLAEIELQNAVGTVTNVLTADGCWDASAQKTWDQVLNVYPLVIEAQAVKVHSNTTAGYVPYGQIIQMSASLPLTLWGTASANPGTMTLTAARQSFSLAPSLADESCLNSVAPVTPSALTPTLTMSTTQPNTGQSVTLTAQNALPGTLSLVNAITGQTLITCHHATSCTTSVTELTQDSPVSMTYQALWTGYGTTNASSMQTVTWQPMAVITANRWWLNTTNQTIGSAGLTLPAGTNDQVWWSFSVTNPQSSYLGWSQGWWNSPDTSSPSFQGTVGWLPTTLGPGTYHIDLTFFFANGAVQELISPPITIT